MTEKLVSVVLPVYNREDTIKRAVDSVLCQTYSDIELIIVDDASTDRSAEIVSAYQDQRIRLICLNKHGGANKARNIGIEHSRGEYIAFQDSDDEWCRNKLEVQVSFMQTKGYLVCFSPYYLHKKEGVSIIPGDFRTNKGYYNNLAGILKCHNVVGTPTLIFKKEIVSLLHGKVFDEILPRFQEYELLIRLVQLVDIGYIDEPLVYAYQDGNNISKNRGHLYEAAGRILKKHGSFLDKKSFLYTYIIKDAEYEEVVVLLEGLEAMQDIAGDGLDELKAAIITYLHDRLRDRSLALEKLYQAALASMNRKRFVVYGTGTVASKFYKKISCRGLRPDGFIVTSIGNDEPKTIDGIRVSAAEDYTSRDILVMVCVSPKYQKDIMDNLIRLGYSDICIYYDA